MECSLLDASIFSVKSETRPCIENEQGQEVLVVCGKRERHEKNALKEWEN